MTLEEVLKERLGTLIQHMNIGGIDAVLVTDPCHRRYLVDDEVVQGYGCVLINRQGDLVHIVGKGRKSGVAEELGGQVRTFTDYDMQDWANPRREFPNLVLQTLLEWGPKTLGVDVSPTLLDPAFSRFLRNCELIEVRSSLENQRVVKAEYEVARIRMGGEVNAEAYAAIRESARAGMTEVELFAAMTAGAMKGSGRPVNFVGKSDLVSGPRTMDAGGPPSSRVLLQGDTIIADLFPTVEGYHADNCRSFVVGGRPTAHQSKMRDVVLRALEKAESLLRPGVRASDVFHGVNEVLQTFGSGYSLAHHAGHGIGVEDQERPYLVPGSTEVLQEGMVISVEPGIYANGVGIRIENVYHVTSGRPVNLTTIADHL